MVRRRRGDRKACILEEGDVGEVGIMGRGGMLMVEFSEW